MRRFVMERIHKLLIPFICCVILLVPFQTLFARKFFYGYAGGFVENWGYFFTHLTDFSGYDGAFSPGHLWFILFLFLISMFSLIVFSILPYPKAAKKVEKLPVWGVLLLFIPVWLMYYLGNFGGFSLGKNLALFLIVHLIRSIFCINRYWWHLHIMSCRYVIYFPCRYFVSGLEASD